MEDLLRKEWGYRGLCLLYTSLVLDELVVYLLDEIRAAVAQLGQVLDRVLDQVEAVDLVLHPHVKRGGDGASSL